MITFCEEEPLSALLAIVRYAKLAPGAVADEAAAVLDALAVERPITGRAA
jgi:hypothetical protein